MELLITIAYAFLIRLIFFDYKLLRFNLFWKFVVFGIWIGAALTEVLALGQFAPYSKSAFVQTYVVQMAPEWGGRVDDVLVKPNVPVKKGDPLFRMDPTEKQNTVDLYTAQLAAAEKIIRRRRAAGLTCSSRPACQRSARSALSSLLTTSTLSVSSSCSSGLSAGVGSTSNTSSPAPAMRRCTRAS